MRCVRLLHPGGSLHPQNHRIQRNPVNRRSRDVQTRLPLMFLPLATPIAQTSIPTGQLISLPFPFPAHEPREEIYRNKGGILSHWSNFDVCFIIIDKCSKTGSIKE